MWREGEVELHSTIEVEGREVAWHGDQLVVMTERRVDVFTLSPTLWPDLRQRARRAAALALGAVGREGREEVLGQMGGQGGPTTSRSKW